jgi:hypothetical protein
MSNKVQQFYSNDKLLDASSSLHVYYTTTYSIEAWLQEKFEHTNGVICSNLNYTYNRQFLLTTTNG